MKLWITFTHSDLEVTLITPDSVPGVLDEPVVQASGFISAIAFTEHTMVYRVKVIIVVVTIVWIDEAACVWMDVNTVGRDSDADRPVLLKVRL